MLKIIYIANETSSQMNHALLSAHRSIFCGLTQSSSQPVLSSCGTTTASSSPFRPHWHRGFAGAPVL